MTKTSKKAKAVAALAVAVSAFSLSVGAQPASADPGPTSSDIVGVGSDTLQYLLDFGADGDYLGDTGFNAGTLSRLDSFDATPDANARSAYLAGSSDVTAFSPTIILRGGSNPVYRPNGSGDGANALTTPGYGFSVYPQSYPVTALRGTLNQEIVNFARMSSLPSTTNTGNAALVKKGSTAIGLKVVRIASDDLAMLAGTSGSPATTHATPLTKNQLLHIYAGLNSSDAPATLKWSDFGGGSSTTIKAVLPQYGSGTRKTFLQDMGWNGASSDIASNGTIASGAVNTLDSSITPTIWNAAVGTPGVAPGNTNITVGEENDPTAVSGNADAMEPMSAGRLRLFQNRTVSGSSYGPYFNVPSSSKPNGSTALAPTPVPLSVSYITSGTPSGQDAGTNPTVYQDIRGLYIVYRDFDQASTTAFNGSTSNWVNTLFEPTAANEGGTTGYNEPYFETAAGQSLLAAAGVLPDYSPASDNATTQGAFTFPIGQGINNVSGTVVTGDANADTANNGYNFSNIP